MLGLTIPLDTRLTGGYVEISWDNSNLLYGYFSSAALLPDMLPFFTGAALGGCRTSPGCALECSVIHMPAKPTVIVSAYMCSVQLALGPSRHLGLLPMCQGSHQPYIS